VGRRFSLLRFFLVLATLAVVFVAASRWWLPLVGSALMVDDAPAKADLGVVLGGDYWGYRIQRAAQLVQQGYVPQVLISGPPGFYGVHECDLAIPFIVRKGYPASGFIPFPHDALSTQAEAAVVLAELRRRNVHSVLIVTSDFHTGRAKRTFLYEGRKIGYLPQIRMIAAGNPLFRIDHWWREREGQKAIFFEWTKTAAFAVGL